MNDDFYLDYDVEDCPACGGEGVCWDAHFDAIICTECGGSGLKLRRKRNRFKIDPDMKKPKRYYYCRYCGKRYDSAYMAELCFQQDMVKIEKSQDNDNTLNS